MIEIIEKQITLRFQDHTGACKYDETPFYKKNVQNLQETKAVDVVANSSNTIYLIELKDMRGYRIDNKKRIENGELALEAAQKFRDTIAGLWGAMRHQNELGNLTKNIFLREDYRIMGILLLEEDKIKTEKLKRVRAALKTKLENYCKFMKIRVNIVTREEFESKFSTLLVSYE